MGHERARALVIEDDVDSRALFREILADAEIEAVCIDGDELPEADGFNVVVADLRDPVRTRYSTTRSHEWVSLLSSRYHVPVIIVTARPEAATDEALKGKAAYVMQKPIDIEQFVERIREAGRIGAV